MKGSQIGRPNTLGIGIVMMLALTWTLQVRILEFSYSKHLGKKLLYMVYYYSRQWLVVGIDAKSYKALQNYALF